MNWILTGAIVFLAAGLFKQTEASEAVKYQGQWKWTDGQFAKNNPGSITSELTKISEELIKGKFFWKKDVYEIDMKVEKKGSETLVSGKSNVSNKEFSLTGKLLPTGEIDGTYNNGKNNGWIKLQAIKK